MKYKELNVARPICREKRTFVFIRSRLKSFAYAANGISVFFKTETNAAIHLFVAFMVLIVSVLLNISSAEIIVVTFSIAFVWVTEMINTAIERTMDLISPEEHPEVKVIKDIAAGAVLMASISAVIAGCIIFIPKLFLV